ncbi:polysaccharide deacetylase family protein [Colwellia sp. 1_MG-2023]|uniref:polysaccharide deacetylase family protein n=1 Tax=Colwellia sp. 1_MG-2023 TaxID=3062649 RepID=UPI0026E11D48|nr:polysaccharide deacetylase family protein [Colwellia sp. 1_MG-2023]MDO6444700.1 polysaccharide deacetylase family protein [Colwellia sp. 1_MG-2023]
MKIIFDSVIYVKILLVCTLLINTDSQAETHFKWPNNAKAAVSLSYDDALDSQLDNALPALIKHNIKATFYLSLTSNTISTRLNEWRALAKLGYELGNHSINHACRGSLPGREWVPAHNDLDKKFFLAIIQEIQTANSFLQAIDGEKLRTFTVPCTDQIVENKNYVHALQDSFIGIKSHVGQPAKNMTTFDRFNAPFMAPSNVTGQALIDYVKQAKKYGTIAHITFHGIGGDHLSVSNKAHSTLLAYLSKNKKDYWVDTYRNISQYLAKSNH